MSDPNILRLWPSFSNFNRSN